MIAFLRWLLLLVGLVVIGCSPDPRPPLARQSSAPILIQQLTPADAPLTPIALPAAVLPRICLLTRTQGVPATYKPQDLAILPKEVSVQPGVQLRGDAARGVQELIAAAWDDGQRLLALSGYRSYEEQRRLLEQETAAYGAALAQRQVAQPGYSEHQLGEAVDITSARAPYRLDESFAREPEGQWLAANAVRFGFVVSYPAGKEAVTGYVYEPWHVRYVGVSLAQQIVASGRTLMEHLPANRMDGCPLE